MLQATSDALYRHLLDAFPPTQAYGPSAFNRAPMPAEVSHFLMKTLAHRLAFELERLESPWFDETDEKVAIAFDALQSALMQTARIPQAEWERALENAVGIVLSYLVRPTHTLAGFIFGKENAALKTEVILRRMDYFNVYPYFRDILAAHLNRKGIEEVNKERFLDLLSQIDRRMTDGFLAQQWVVLLSPLYHLFETIRPNQIPSKLETALLAVFFQDKGELGLYRRLLFEDQMRGLSTMTAQDLEGLIEAYQATPQTTDDDSKAEAKRPTLWQQFQTTPPTNTSLASETREEAPLQPEPNTLSINEIPSGPNPIPQNSLSSTLEALSEVPQADHPAEVTTSEASLPLPSLVGVIQETGLKPRLTVQAHEPEPSLSLTNTEAVEEVEESNRYQPKPAPVQLPSASGLPLWKQFNVIPSTERVPLVQTAQDRTHQAILQLEPFVLGFLTQERRAWFLRSLFNNSMGFYLEVLQQLNACKTWTEASQVIAINLFLKNNIDIYSEAAVAFTDTVEARFMQARRPNVSTEGKPA